MDNEIIFCELLPELSRKFENTKFDDSLCVAIRDVVITRSDVERSNEQTIIVECENLKAIAFFEECKRIQQVKISQREEMMFGIFGFENGKDNSQENSTNIAKEINAQLILPKSSEDYVTQFPLRLDHDIVDKDLFEEMQEIFRTDKIKVRQERSNEIFLHVDYEEIKQTPRSIIFESIWILFKYLLKQNSFQDYPLQFIESIYVPFVHFGNVRICMSINLNTMIANVKLFNFYGSLFGKIDNIGGEQNNNESKIVDFQEAVECNFNTTNYEDELFEILRNRMKIAKNYESVVDVLNVPLPYIGVDSLRIVELEYYLKERYENVNKLGNAFLMTCRTLKDVVGVIEEANGKDERIAEKEYYSEKRFEETVNEIDLHDPINCFRVPLSSQQKRILFIRELEPNTTQFDEPVRIRFAAPGPDTKKLINALNFLILRHSILRSRYFEDYQYLLSGTECFIHLFQKCSKTEKYESLRCIMENDKDVLLIFDHSIVDGKTLGIFYEEFRRKYLEPHLEMGKVLQYMDYCKTKTEEDIEARKYWKDLVSKVEDDILPTDIPRAKIIGKSRSISMEIPEKLKFKMDKIGQGASRFETFVTLLQLAFKHVFGCSNINFGYAVDLRTFDFSGTMGCFTNILPLFLQSSPHENFEKLLEKCKKSMKEGRKYGNYPFEKISKGREGNLFQILVVSDQIGRRNVRFADEEEEFKVVGIEDIQELDAKYDQVWYLRHDLSVDTLKIQVDYAKDLYFEETIQFQMEYLLKLINGKNKLNFGLVKKADFPNQAVSQIINKFPLKIHEEKCQKSSQYSKCLQTEILRKFGQFSSTEAAVILKLPRNKHLVEMIMSIWKCGAYPVTIHKDTTENGVAKVCKQLKDWIYIDETSKCLDISPNVRIFNGSTLWDMAYATSTSGSTGDPKLVATGFEGHSNLARQYAESFQISEKDTICQIVDPSFDIFFADLVKTFTNNATLLLCKDSIPSESEIKKCTNAYIMPAFLSRLPSIDILSNLEVLQYGGEPLNVETLRIIRAALPNLKIFQEFGLTEQTVYSSRARIRKTDQMRQLGEPYANIALVVMAEDSLAPDVCLNGQLYLKGCGLMRGYFGQEMDQKELKTGDDVARAVDGNLYFIGRKDAQVKVRGHRIDLFEIESTALSSGLLKSATCIMNLQNQLVLFYQTVEIMTNFDVVDQLNLHFEKQLVAYKIPNHIIELENFPLTRTGKIDKQKLKSMKIESRSENNAVRDVDECIDEKLIKALKNWLEKYSESKIRSIDADIFKCGIDSISVMLTIQKLRTEGFEIKAKNFFKFRTLRKIVSNYQHLEIKIENKKEICSTKAHYIEFNHIQERILFLSRFAENPELFRMNFTLKLENRRIHELVEKVNRIIIGNMLLRSIVSWKNGKYCFEIVSGTECFRNLKSVGSLSSKTEYDMNIWIEKQMIINLSIHHVVCDGRSLQILKNQLESRDSIRFSNSFQLAEPFRNELPMTIDNKILYPEFSQGSQLAEKRIIRIPNTLEFSEVSFIVCKSLAIAFNLEHQFNIAMTFANRTPENWETVGMFANTIPVQFDPNNDDLEKWRNRINFYNEKYSNIDLKKLVKSSGPFADFAINLHHEGADFSQPFSQFPILFTFIKLDSRIVVDFDPTCIKKQVIDNLENMICGQKEKSLKDVIKSIYQELLQMETIEDNADFFNNGGHSLTAMKAIDKISEKIGKELPIKVIFENPILQNLVEAVERLTKGQGENEVTRRIGRFLVTKVKESAEKLIRSEISLSSQQLQMFYLSQLTTSTTEYQLPFIQPFPDSIDVTTIHSALLKTIQQQSIFRTIFEMNSDTGEPFQRVISMTECFVQCKIEELGNRSELDQRIRQHCEEEIDILDGRPAIRAVFVKSKNPMKNVAFLHVHHLISDARSTQIVNETMRRFMEDSSPRRMEYNYADYCEDKNHKKHEEIDEKYLNTILNGVENIANGLKQSNKIHIDIRKELLNFETTPFTGFLQSISQALLRFFNKESINIAFPVLNRNEKTSNICGYFLNNLVINCTNSIESLDVLNIIQNNYQYSNVVQKIRSLSNADKTIANVYLNCRYDLEFDETDEMDLLELIPLKTHYPIEFDVDLLDDIWRITLRSNSLKNEEMIEILNDVRRGMMSEDVHVLPKVINGKRHDIPRDSLPNLFEMFFKSSSTFLMDAPRKTNYSYSECWKILKTKASSIRRDVLQSRGQLLRPDDIIGVIGSKSITTTLTCISVQLAGAGYLPIDESYPKSKILDVSKNTIHQISQLDKTIEINGNIRFFNISSLENLSYSISTSGTTGPPKAVCIAAQSQVNLFCSSTCAFHVNSKSGIYQFTNFVFDNSVLEVSMAIASQSRLIFDSEPFDVSSFSKLTNVSNGVTHCLLFPSLVQAFEIQRLTNLEYWIVGGERLPKTLLNSAAETQCRIIQNYGPTETTAFAVYRRMHKNGHSTTIGKPSMNTKVVINAENNTLLIDGIGRMRGYMGRTDNSFVDFYGNQWYDSGDICRIENDEIIFEGRKDSQIKIRGYRVELQEIESVIESHPSVLICKTSFDQDNQQISAYFTSKSPIDSEEIRKYCETHLEKQKIPSFFNEIGEFPLTNNSKVDVSLLKKSRPVVTKELVFKSSSKSEKLSEIWLKLLKTTPKESDHFFQLGGHSLLLIRLRHLIQTEFKIVLTVGDILNNLKFSDQLEMISTKTKRTFVFFPALYGGCTAYLKLSSLLQQLQYTCIFLEEAFGESVESIANEYKKQIDNFPKIHEKVTFVGASAAGTMAFATSCLFSQPLEIILLDTGTYWSNIQNLVYDSHCTEIAENLKMYGVDNDNIEKLCKSSWKMLQILKTYNPSYSSNYNHKCYIFSIDGTDLGWKRFSNNCEIVKIGGDHYSMLKNEAIVNEIVEKFVSL